jgi:hypothetical protein
MAVGQQCKTWMSETNSTEKITGANLEIWRESLAHLRHLGDDVWNGLKLFLFLNAFVLAGIIGTIKFHPLEKRTTVLLLFLSLLGMSLTLVARYILKRHRVYYLQMLLKKSLIEADLGFYESKIAGSQTDLAFPWRLTPEVVSELKTQPEEWIQKSIRSKGTIARLQFLIYETLIGIYLVLLLISIFAF